MHTTFIWVEATPSSSPTHIVSRCRIMWFVCCGIINTDFVTVNDLKYNKMFKCDEIVKTYKSCSLLFYFRSIFNRIVVNECKSFGFTRSFVSNQVNCLDWAKLRELVFDFFLVCIIRQSKYSQNVRGLYLLNRFNI